jgi:hypothetical protein
MKRIALVITLLVFVSCTGFSQSGNISGVVTSVKPHFANTCLLLVNDTELILTQDPKDKTGKAFEINKKFKDLLIEKEGQYVLNPKYSGKKFSFDYTVNGKGWKCIHSVKLLRK